MRRVRTVALVVLFALVGAGCGGAASADGPPEINYGRDICVHCGMMINDDRFAAAYTLGDGTEKKFDDIGGLLIHAREMGEVGEATVWVSDFDEKVLIDAKTAFFVPTLGVTSPMGHGILAFATRERAEAFAADLGGTVITWEEVLALPVDHGLLGEHHDHD